ncbi:hypothetical protein FDA77_07015 [Clostridium botulinum]|uniref:hypothetical protein n=1 Tax=Clostridium botulinum TaxID=1491 RepID=UPI0013F996ED|nr:hypothetical protein [Clostridium botulinum]MBY6886492.1 hypothetical protein [Clostridium botulinum]NFI45021.1 hypothetical protein [Clostridium botulinum]NFJ89658.1 hypothetical protein [Clostridium botulinum]HBJ2608378.1 hypothetical protein [Clostridium botulinum]HDI3118714.1 hypothetical protein [Clostridium botulinum]
MIIEGAFLKIPEILMSYDNPDGLYEANITNLFTMGIVLELNARNIDNPLNKIQMEKRYDRNINVRCDMYLDFSQFLSDEKLNIYGIKNKNWIEAKYFGGLKRNSGSETKSENAGSIIYDIFRIIKNTHENNCIDDAKYVVCIFNEKPDLYLALNRKDKSRREWIDYMLSSGISQVVFEKDKEPKSIRKYFEQEGVISINTKVRTTDFIPIENDNTKVRFWGYLIQVLEYEIVTTSKVYTNK